MSNNVMTALPVELGRLTKMRQLYLNSNQLTELPPSLGTMTLLQELNLADNPLRGLPTELGNIQKLKSLIVDAAAVNAVPGAQDDDIHDGKSLAQTTEHDKEMGMTTKTKTQEADGASVMESLQRMFHAQKSGFLDLSGMGLSLVPSEVQTMSSLTQLALDHNMLKELTEAISGLASLVRLSICNNQLVKLHPSFAQLSLLKELSLSNNELTTLPEEILVLSGLKRLAIDHNRLTALPFEMGNMPLLRKLKLHSNDIQSPPREVVMQGTSVMLAYLKALCDGSKAEKLDLSTFGLLELPPEVCVCLLYTSPSPRDATLSRMPSSA